MNLGAPTPDRFAICLALTLVYEGGWSDHASDPGKATMQGITQAVYDNYRLLGSRPLQSVRSIGRDELLSIYRTRYWNAIRADSLPVGVDYALFDFAVNSGVRRATIELQHLLGIQQDGSLGPKTLAAIEAFCRSQGAARLSDGVCTVRLRFIRALPTFAIFGKGWEARIMGSTMGSQLNDTGVADRALQMTLGNSPSVPAAPANTQKTFVTAA